MKCSNLRVFSFSKLIRENVSDEGKKCVMRLPPAAIFCEKLSFAIDGGVKQAIVFIPDMFFHDILMFVSNIHRGV